MQKKQTKKSICIICIHLHTVWIIPQMMMSVNCFCQLYLESHKRSHRNAATAAASRRKGVSTRSKSLVWWKTQRKNKEGLPALQGLCLVIAVCLSSHCLLFLFFRLWAALNFFLSCFLSRCVFRTEKDTLPYGVYLSKFVNVCVCVLVFVLWYEFP